MVKNKSSWHQWTLTKKVFLAHLSHENNTEKKALDTLYQTLKKKDITFPSISIAKQDVATEVVEV